MTPIVQDLILPGPDFEKSGSIAFLCSAKAGFLLYYGNKKTFQGVAYMCVLSKNVMLLVFPDVHV